MRTIKYLVATSIDGFIAHADGSWTGMVEKGDHVDDFMATIAECGDVLMGRRTYQAGLDLGVTDPYPTLRQWVYSTSMAGSPSDNVTVISTGAAAHARELKAEAGKDIWLCGGAALAGALFAEGLVDAVSVKVNPVVFGSGIPLFGGPITPTSLALVGHRIFESGVARLDYRVN